MDASPNLPDSQQQPVALAGAEALRGELERREQLSPRLIRCLDQLQHKRDAALSCAAARPERRDLDHGGNTRARRRDPRTAAAFSAYQQSWRELLAELERERAFA
jgi:hypothetical protein